MSTPSFEVERLGRLGYARALEVQRRHHAAMLEGRAAGVPHRILVVEHLPVITVTQRPGAEAHVTAGPGALASRGIEVHATDRGGDVTYHGPGQAVAYPIVDLQRLGIGVHAYIRALEEAAIRTCAAWGIACHREKGATGVWAGDPSAAPAGTRKIAAIGVRVSRGIAMHGMALNVDPDLGHFGLIVPCGLHGRQVTSMRAELGDGCPSFPAASERLAAEVAACLLDAWLTRPSATAP